MGFLKNSLRLIDSKANSLLDNLKNAPIMPHTCSLNARLTQHTDYRHFGTVLSVSGKRHIQTKTAQKTVTKELKIQGLVNKALAETKVLEFDRKSYSNKYRFSFSRTSVLVKTQNSQESDKMEKIGFNWTVLKDKEIFFTEFVALVEVERMSFFALPSSYFSLEFAE